MKKFVAVLIGLLVVVVVAAFVLPRFVDAGAYRAEIASRIAAIIGRPVAIDGPMDFVLLPSPRLRASGVRSASDAAADGFGIEAKRIDLQLGWRSLLGGPIEVTQLRIIEPTITVETRSESGNGWHFPGFDATSSVRIERTDIENGRLVWSDARFGTRETVDQVQARITASAIGSGLRATGSAVTHAVPFEFDALLGDVPAGRPKPVSLTVGLRPNLARVTLRGTIDPGRENAFRGRLQIEGEDLFAASDTLGLAPPPASVFAGALSQPFAITGEMTWADKAVVANALSLQVGDIRASGAANWTLARVPVLDASLNMTWIDLDRLARLQRPRGDADQARARRRAVDGAVVAPVSGAAPNRVSGVPKDFDASLDLNIEALALNGGVVRQVRLNAALNRGDLVINRASALLPGGTEMSGFAQIAPGADPVRVEGTLALQSDNLRGLLTWLGVDARGVPADRLRRFEGRTRIGGALKRLELTDLDIRFDSSRLTGGITLATAARPALGVDLRLDRINIDGYLGSDAAPQTPPPSGETAIVLSRALLDRFDANLKLRANTITFDGVPINGVALDGTLQNGALELRGLEIKDAAGGALHASGRVNGVAQTPAATLDVSLHAADATRLLRLVDLSPPANPSLTLSGQLAIQADGGVEFENLALALGDTPLHGRARLAAGIERRLTIDLKGEAVRLSALPGLLPGGSGAPGADFDAVINAASLMFGRQRIDDARLETRIDDGALVAAALTGTLYGGALEISARGEGQDRTTLNGTLALKQAEIEEAFRALAGAATMIGKADLHVDFSTSAQTPDSLSALSGRAELTAGEGMIEGLDLSAMNRMFARVDPPADIVALLGAGLNTGSTPYRALTATARIQNGVLRSDDLRIVTDFGEAKGGGTVDLDRAAMDFGLALPVGTGAGVPPLRITASGTFDAPRVAVDFAQLQDYLLRRRADNPAVQPRGPDQ